VAVRGWRGPAPALVVLVVRESQIQYP
jgi:hypothetical protein